MKIAPVSLNNRSYKPNFNASLYVQSGSYAKSNEGTYEVFQMVMNKFKEKLANDPLHPEDLVVVSPIKQKCSVKTSRGVKEANLRIAIDDYSSDFYYNSSRCSDNIAEDLYNTYKHVRYLRHYA